MGCGYCRAYSKKDTVITVTLNVRHKTIAYKINDKQTKTKAINLSMNKYRHAVALTNSNNTIALSSNSCSCAKHPKITQSLLFSAKTLPRRCRLLLWTREVSAL